MIKSHSFHIPVMGIGFTIDTPLKVAHYGIDSVISLVDDVLLEKLRKMYCGKFELPYLEITDKSDDFRAKRITSYLNLINELAERKFEELKSSAAEIGTEIKKYFNMLPDASNIKQQFLTRISKYIDTAETGNWIKDKLSMGSIDVNIMTKLDKENYNKDEKLPVEYNDAHAALRGYANSDLTSSIVFSAGMNPRLYSYLERFDDFYPDAQGFIKKKVILKVSDYRSALIQGKYLAKKGIWISEYRIESGLNCGGHAFATDGFLMGPILAEFRDNRNDLINVLHGILTAALSAKNKPVPQKALPLRVTAQGGVGTSAEHNFLLDHYDLDSIGWGTPFLLVPEVTNVDESTLDQLIAAKEEDLYLSDISPLGVPFNSLRGNSKDIEKTALIVKGRPGSSCPKEFVAINNKEFTERNICTASRQYQHLKIKELDSLNFSSEDYKIQYEKIVDKSCLCVGLGTSALLVNDLDTKTEGEGVSICPGPNLAYFSKQMNLEEITDHIYGRDNVITRTDRPHMFMKELKLYMDFLKDRIAEKIASTEKREKYLLNFASNLSDGIDYYSKLFDNPKEVFEDLKTILADLDLHKNTLSLLRMEIEGLSVKTSAA